MKKTYSILLALLICLSLCACGGSDSTSSNNTSAQSTTAQDTSSESIYYDRLGIMTQEAFEVVDSNVSIITNRGDISYAHVFVKIKNVSDVSVSLTGSLNSYDLIKEDGTILEEQNYFLYNSTQAVKPGEMFYLCDFHMIDRQEPGETITCVIHGDIDADVQQLENTMRTHEVSNIEISKNEDSSYLLMTCDVDCGEVAAGRLIDLTSIGFDASGTPICVFYGYVDKDETVSGESVTAVLKVECWGDLSPEDIASYSPVYACSISTPVQ